MTVVLENRTSPGDPPDRRVCLTNTEHRPLGGAPINDGYHSREGGVGGVELGVHHILGIYPSIWHPAIGI